MKPLSRREVEQHHACWRKRRYVSEVVASRVAKIKGMRVYKCESCHSFHITKRP